MKSFLLVFFLVGLTNLSMVSAQKIDVNTVWAGTWETNWDDGDDPVIMTLTQKGTQVTGNYDYEDGEISGVFNAKTFTLEGTWTQSEDSGWIKFTLSKDGKSFKGTWGYEGEEEEGGPWLGNKIATTPSASSTPPPPLIIDDKNTNSGDYFPELDTGKDVDYLTAEEKKVLYYVNFARAKPALYADKFLASKRKEGAYAEEAYQELKKASAAPALKPSKVLTQSSTYHVKDQGPTGKTGHDSSNGMSMSDRIEKYGNWSSTIGENISYGYNDALQIVNQLIIDDGVTSRGHRKNILNKSFKFMGTNIGTHTQYRFMCVQDFAGGINA